MQWAEGKGVTEFRPSENANGNTLDNEGRLVVASHTGRNVVRTEKDGTIAVLVNRFEEKKPPLAQRCGRKERRHAVDYRPSRTVCPKAQ